VQGAIDKTGSLSNSASTALTFLSASLHCKHCCVCQLVLLQKLDDDDDDDQLTMKKLCMNVR